MALHGKKAKGLLQPSEKKISWDINILKETRIFIVSTLFTLCFFMEGVTRGIVGKSSKESISWFSKGQFLSSQNIIWYLFESNANTITGNYIS